MGWILRFFDGSGAELGWVRADPFDFHVADSTENRQDLERTIRQYDMTMERTGGHDEFTDPDSGEKVITHWDGARRIPDRKAHLDQLGADLVTEFGVRSYSLREEE